MVKSDFAVRPISESCVEISFGSTVSPEFNDRAIALDLALRERGLPWITESVPSYSSLAVYFDPCKFGGSDSAVEAVSMTLAEIATEAGSGHRLETRSRTIVIPATFGGQDGPDLESIAEAQGLPVDEFLGLFLAGEYRVYMLGFLPGFAYMGILDPRIATPRKAVPRTRVPAGSIGIAENQTGIYPFDSPGGWQIIGSTDLRMFDPEGLSFLKAGDSVRFVDAG